MFWSTVCIWNVQNEEKKSYLVRSATACISCLENATAKCFNAKISAIYFSSIFECVCFSFAFHEHKIFTFSISDVDIFRYLILLKQFFFAANDDLDAHSNTTMIVYHDNEMRIFLPRHIKILGAFQSKPGLQSIESHMTRRLRKSLNIQTKFSFGFRNFHTWWFFACSKKPRHGVQVLYMQRAWLFL